MFFACLKTFMLRNIKYFYKILQGIPVEILILRRIDEVRFEYRQIFYDVAVCFFKAGTDEGVL